jgi:hypothetical protein
VPGLPLAVEPVLRRALRKRAADRYGSIREFSHAFASAALGEPVELTPAPAHQPASVADGSARGIRRSGFMRAVIVAAAAAAVVLLGVVWWPRPHGAPPLPKAAHGPIVTPLVGPQVPHSPDALEPVGAEATPARAKRAKPAKKPGPPAQRPLGRRPLFDRL